MLNYAVFGRCFSVSCSEAFQLFLFSNVFDKLIKLIALKKSYFSMETDSFLTKNLALCKSEIRSLICHQNKGIAINAL